MAGTLTVFLAVVLLTSGCGFARGPGPPRSAQPTLIRDVLGNGMSVVVEARPSSDTVAVQLWVKAGARDEAAAEIGLAHYLEHMVLKGTATSWSAL